MLRRTNMISLKLRSVASPRWPSGKHYDDDDAPLNCFVCFLPGATMRFSSVVSAVFGLCTAVLSTDTNATTDPTQISLQGDFQPPAVFENTNLVRNINLEKGYVRETTNILVTNTGKEAQTEYYVPFEDDLIGKIGGFDARDKKKPDGGPLEVTVAVLAGVDGESSK
jgi:oligosaccharyltransferase complex subunit alpha (ribophorin I)